MAITRAAITAMATVTAIMRVPITAAGITVVASWYLQETANTITDMVIATGITAVKTTTLTET